VGGIGRGGFRLVAELLTPSGSLRIEQRDRRERGTNKRPQGRRTFVIRRPTFRKTEKKV